MEVGGKCLRCGPQIYTPPPLGDTPGDPPGDPPGGTPGDTPGHTPGEPHGERPGDTPGDARRARYGGLFGGLYWGQFWASFRHDFGVRPEAAPPNHLYMTPKIVRKPDHQTVPHAADSFNKNWLD